ncbi:4-cresol dehydrogenase [Luteitalea sp. TBR-22]|uniref:FAD-binding oxidoreductase n=1 Tax=Luteitalea sp. TBR-22 TaxID=2802971 RepID=UPI001AF272B7|nr:FAD-binding oxidoreductase [Luteitalea sp. TBR-22]BCS32013.1 4-cresol dehydrogenase [Luteitalea sp. TBR-22]
MSTPSADVSDVVCDDFRAIVGPDNVVAEGDETRAASTATFATTARVPLIVRPGSRDEVQACVRAAMAHGLALYPISSGLNWGYGSRVPASDGNVLLDLRRMQRIVDFSETLGYVTLEPGVTQQQLFRFLQDSGSRLWMDATGTSPSASLIGNVMERGFGHTPYGDHFAHVCAIEAVLGDGSVVDTGFARFGATPNAPIYRWGQGPVLDGLFTQSNLGIVTRMTIWLMPAPECFEAYFFRLPRPGDLGRAIDALRPLKLSGTLRSAVHIGNDYKVLNGLGQYPWSEMQGRTPIMPRDMEAFRQRLRIGLWNGSGGLYGTRAQVREARRLVRRHLSGIADRLEFLDDRRLALARRFAGLWGRVTGWDLSATLTMLGPVYGLMRGVPTDHPLASAYWRKRTPPPAQMDPDRDRCGLLWCAPVAPMEGGHAERLVAIASDVLLSYGFEPLISITLVTERAITCVVSISFDRDVPGEDARALSCYHALFDALHDAGYHAYRLGLPAMPREAAHDSARHLLDTLKRACDPHDVIAPGRYGLGRR